MANTLKFKRGIVSTIPTAALGEPLFTTDTFDLYIGNGTGNTRFQKYIASGTTSQLLRGDGSLLTMPIVLTSPANGEVLKYNGTNWVNSADAGVTGSATAGQVTFWNSASTITGSNNLFWDATNNRLGIGTNVPLQSLHISKTTGGNIYLQDSDFTSTHNITELARGANSFQIITRNSSGGFVSSDYIIEKSATTTIHTWIKGDNTSSMRLHNTGNLHIGGTTDNGQRLQVTGDAFIKGSGNTNATLGLTVQDSDGNNIFRVANGGRLFVGSAGTNQIAAADTNNSTLNSGTNLSILYASSSQSGFGVNFKSGNANQRTYTSGSGGVILLNDGFAPTSGNGTFDFLRFAATINQTGGANGITRGLYVNPTLTAAADWRSIEWSNNTGFGLYGGGSATNVLLGPLSIGEQTIGTNILNIRANLTGSTIYNSVRVASLALSDVTNIASAFRSEIGTQNAVFTLSTLAHFHARQGSFGASSIVTNQYGFWAVSNLTSATNNYGFYGDIASGTGRWNLYMNGTAANYLNGNLGLGTTNPLYKLQVSSSVSSALVNSNYDDVFIENLGNTGITIGSGTTSNGALVFSDSGSNVAGYLLYSHGTDSLVFGTNASDKMRLDASGRLGIGTTAPNSVLEVAGTAATTDFRISRTISSSIYFYIKAPGATPNTAIMGVNGIDVFGINANGNAVVGIGADTGEKLQVNGTMKVTGASTFTTGSVPFYGLRLLNYNGVTTDRQLYLGVIDDSHQTIGNAYYFNSSSFRTTTTTGSFIDFSQGRFRVFTDSGLTANTNYTPTVRFTIDSGGAATFSSSVTANSFAINTSGQSRTITTFYGSGSDGSNIFIGGGGLSSTTGGGAATNGSYNTTLGVNALLSNTTGYSNTVMGASSMVYNTTGLNNSAFGRSSLGDNTTGDDNTSVGLAALLTNTTGDGNTALGFQAGWGTGTNANTTGGNNIFIGNLSVGESATESNRTWIGNTSTASTWVGGNLLVGTRTNGSYKADINGTLRATQFNLSALNTAPATSSSTGTLGEIRIDADHIYVCTATNTWKRVAIATF